jgi:hypothetical protein
MSGVVSQMKKGVSPATGSETAIHHTGFNTFLLVDDVDHAQRVLAQWRSVDPKDVQIVERDVSDWRPVALHSAFGIAKPSRVIEAIEDES